MWQIYYTVAGENELRVESVCSEAEMLMAVRRDYSRDGRTIDRIEGPNGQKLSAAQAGLFSMLYEKKSDEPVRPQASAAIKRMLALKQVGLPKLPGIRRAPMAQAYAGQRAK